MEYCTNCGTQVDPKDNFCPNCGTAINPAHKPSASAEKSTTVVIALAMLSLVIMGGAAFAVFALQETPTPVPEPATQARVDIVEEGIPPAAIDALNRAVNSYSSSNDGILIDAAQLASSPNNSQLIDFQVSELWCVKAAYGVVAPDGGSRSRFLVYMVDEVWRVVDAQLLSNHFTEVGCSNYYG